MGEGRMGGNVRSWLGWGGGFWGGGAMSMEGRGVCFFGVTIYRVGG